MTQGATHADPITRTLLIAALVALACSAMVSGAVYWLKPVQAAHQLVERNRTIVGLTSLNTSEATDSEVTQAFLDLDARVWDLSAHEFEQLLDGHSYNHWASPETENTAQADPRYVPVYLVHGNSVAIVLPVHGDGMWSTIYGYVGLAPDYNTIVAIDFHQHGETPGIGDRIQDPAWLATWHGKRIYDANGQAQIRVGAARADAPAQAAHRIDLISGASVTSEKVGAFVQAWMGPDGYAPLLASLRAEAAKR